MAILFLIISQWQFQNGTESSRVCFTYPSSAGVHWAIASHGCVLVEVLGDRQAHEEGEPHDELGPEAVQVTELQEAETTSACKAYEL